MNYFDVVCDNCGASLEVADDVERFECPNCGCELLMITDAPEDESGQTDDYEVEEYEDHYVDGTPKNQPRRGGLAALLVIALLFIGVGFYLGTAKPAPLQEALTAVVGTPEPVKTIRWPLSFKEAKAKSYDELSKLLKNQGYTNVKGIPVDIPKINITRIKPGDIKEIDVFSAEQEYHNKEIEKHQELWSNAEIRISYYDY